MVPHPGVSTCFSPPRQAVLHGAFKKQRLPSTLFRGGVFRCPRRSFVIESVMSLSPVRCDRFKRECLPSAP